MASRLPSPWHAALLGVACLAIAIVAIERRSQVAARAESSKNRPIEVHERGYVSSDTCRSCHPSEHRSWHASYHRTMTQPATKQHVITELDGVVLEHGGERFRLERDGDGFVVHIGTREPTRHPLALVTGAHHMQVYWYETGKDRTLGQLPYVFLRGEDRFIPRAAAFLEPPRDVRPLETGRWNDSCIHCHTTRGSPRIDKQGVADTRVAELGIACEACHGPAREHLARHGSPLERYAGWLRADDAPDDSIVQPERLDHAAASAVCSQCHAIWLTQGSEAHAAFRTEGSPLRPGKPTTDSYYQLQPSRAAQDRRIQRIEIDHPDYILGQFWPDGMARVSGREHNGMIDSPCYTPGKLSCLSCHEMHPDPQDTRPLPEWANDQLAPRMDGDQACLQCHEELASSLSAHTRHAPESSGSRCYNCHMPHTSYGLLKSIRSHRISSPDVGATVATGRPNACTICHLDRSLGWAAEQLETGWKIKAPELTDDQRTLAAGYVHALRGDAGERALTAAHAGLPEAQRATSPSVLLPLLAVLLDDPYDAVRVIAARSLRTLPHAEGEPLLELDPIPRPQAPPGDAQNLGAVARSLLPKGGAARLPSGVPIQSDGSLDETGKRLLSQRNSRAVNLLE